MRVLHGNFFPVASVPRALNEQEMGDSLRTRPASAGCCATDAVVLHWRHNSNGYKLAGYCETRSSGYKKLAACFLPLRALRSWGRRKKVNGALGQRAVVQQTGWAFFCCFIIFWTAKVAGPSLVLFVVSMDLNVQWAWAVFGLGPFFGPKFFL